MSDEPLVSVVTPVYNADAFLAECIESVLRQTYTTFEYIIVDNCSTDQTFEIAQKYAKADSRIRIHRNDEFVGVMENHNIGVRLISPQARYCKIVCADDFIFPNCISRMVALAEANPTVGIVGAYQLSGDHVKWQGFTYPRAVFSGMQMCRQVLLGGDEVFGFGCPTSVLYRADLVRKTRNFYPNSSPHADTSACYQCLRQSDYGFVYEVLSYERTHGESQSQTSLNINRYASAYLNDVIEYGPYFLDEHEFRNKLDKTVKAYHRFLTVSYLSGVTDEDFWSYHRSRLEELGYPLTHLTILKMLLIAAAQESAHPVQALRRLWKRRRSRSPLAEVTTRVSEISAEQTLAANR